MNRTFKALSLAGLFACAASASAAPIQFVFTGSGSGSLAGQDFGPASFVITEYADTDNIQSCGSDCFSLDSTSASITIESIGTLDFISPTRTFSNQGYTGFSRGGVAGLDLYNVFFVNGYALNTSAGPVANDSAGLLQWDSEPVNTSGGVLVFWGGSTPGTFTATTAPVPVPAAVWLLGSAIGGLGALRRRAA